MVKTDALTSWLADHEFRLDRFRSPLPLAEVAAETGLAEDEVRRAVREADPPVHHVWPQHRLYCLRPAGPAHVGLDWQESLVGALELDFRERGYRIARDVGTAEDVAALVEDPDLESLAPGSEQGGGLWALRRDGDVVELWIVEAQGKQPAGFEHHAVGELLGRMAPVRGRHLTAMLGEDREDTVGRGLTAARALLDGWRERGLEATVHLALALPSAGPDVVWRSGRPTPMAEGLYAEPLRALREFLVSGTQPYEDDGSTARAAFGEMLADVDGAVQLRELAASKSGLCLRVLVAGANPKSGAFEVSGREPVKMSFIRRTADRIRRKLEGLTSAPADADGEAAENDPARDPSRGERDLDDVRRAVAAAGVRIDAAEARLSELDGLASRCDAIETRLAELDELRRELVRIRSLATVALAVSGLLAVAVAIVLWTAV